MIIGKLIPAGTGMYRYRNMRSGSSQRPSPSTGCASARLSDATAIESGEPPLVGITREEAEKMLGGSLSAVSADSEE